MNRLLRLTPLAFWLAIFGVTQWSIVNVFWHQGRQSCEFEAVFTSTTMLIDSLGHYREIARVNQERFDLVVEQWSLEQSP